MNTILIVEDDPVISSLEKDYLEMCGFSVTIESDGARGRELAMKRNFSLVILDVMLPGADGFEILSSVRNIKLVPIIMVSARSSEADVVRALGMGADDYVRKPFSPSELVARVKAIIAREERIRSIVKRDNMDLIASGRLVIDRRMWTVRYDDKDIDMTGKEFELLAFLASNPGTVYTKEEIFDMIWPENLYGDMNTVSVHVSRIRDKLHKSGCDHNYLDTMWGVGYRFVPDEEEEKDDGSE